MAGFGAGVGEGVTSGAGEGDAALAAAGKVGDPGHGAQRQRYALLPNFCYAFLCCGTALGCQQVHASCVSLEHIDFFAVVI